MWKQLYHLAKQLLNLVEESERNRTEIKELRQEMNELTGIVLRLANELRQTSTDEAHEREKLALRLENEMLRFERRLVTSGRRREN